MNRVAAMERLRRNQTNPTAICHVFHPYYGKQVELPRGESAGNGRNVGLHGMADVNVSGGLVDSHQRDGARELFYRAEEPNEPHGTYDQNCRSQNYLHASIGEYGAGRSPERVRRPVTWQHGNFLTEFLDQVPPGKN